MGRLPRTHLWAGRRMHLPFSIASAYIGVPLADSRKESSWSLDKRKNLGFVHEEDRLSRLGSHGAKMRFFPARPQVTVT